MTIYLVGNQLVELDSLPLLLRPHLQKAFPRIDFVEIDPNEDFIPEPGSVVLDTVEGIKVVTWFDSLDDFTSPKTISPHDYDLGFHLKLLKKLGKLESVSILGVPFVNSAEKIADEVIGALKMYF